MEKPCVPGQKGCVLNLKVKTQKLKVEIIPAEYKNKKIARFREN